MAEEDTVLTVLDMTANMEEKLEEILQRLKKLDVIESSVKSIETKLSSRRAYSSIGKFQPEKRLPKILDDPFRVKIR